MNNTKFTLIELLVVVAIIGILVSILMPSLHRAREKAKLAVCISNNKQIMTAYNSYALENDDYAVAHRWYNSHSGTQGWKDWCDDTVEERELNPYLEGGYKVSHCPGDKGDPLYNWNDKEADAMGSSFVVGWSGGTFSMFHKSTNVGYVGDISVVGFEYPARKSGMHSVILRHGRDWDDPSGQSKWHSDKHPTFTLPFIDGHVVAFNMWWKKRVDYDPGNSFRNNIDRLVDEIGFY